jgi:carbamoyl-phosphate synthase large subunit
VKEAVFPFIKFPGVDTILGPEMKSTGEVMGVGRTFGEAFVKSQLAAGTRLPKSGKVFLSVKPADRPKAVEVARELHALGFPLVATRGTGGAISEAAGIPVGMVNKVTEGRPHIVDMIKNGEIVLIVNTVEEKRTAIADSRSIRTSAWAPRSRCSPPSRAVAPPAPACATMASKPIHCRPCTPNYSHERKISRLPCAARSCCALNCSA